MKAKSVAPHRRATPSAYVEERGDEGVPGANQTTRAAERWLSAGASAKAGCSTSECD